MRSCLHGWDVCENLSSQLVLEVWTNTLVLVRVGEAQEGERRRSHRRHLEESKGNKMVESE